MIRITSRKALLICVLLVGCGGEGGDVLNGTGESHQPAACEDPYPVLQGCEEAACEMARCGAPDSFLDENRCKRRTCERDEQCGPDEECRSLRYLLPSCGYSDEGDECYCGSNLTNIDEMLCLPRE